MAILNVKLFKGYRLTDCFVALTPAPDHQWTEIRVSVHDSEISISDGLALYEMIKAFPAEKKSAHIYGIAGTGSYSACLSGSITMSETASIEFKKYDVDDAMVEVISRQRRRDLSDALELRAAEGSVIYYAERAKRVGLIDAIGYPSEEETKT